jgi:lactate dehydrogenase-like 2-hydroxyacid dehydrogenase
MKPEVISLAPFYQPSLTRLERELTVHRLWQHEERETLLREVGPRARGVQAIYTSPVDARLMSALPRLEIISVFGVGYEGVDVTEAKRRGIIVTNTPDVLNDCVADLAIALLLAAARRVPEGDRYIRGGRWPLGPLPLGRKVSGKRLGIVGLGRIGRVIAKRAQGFDLEIAYHNRRRDETLPYAYFDSVAALAEHSDFLVIATPGGAATRHLIDARVLHALGPDGILVNVARGSVVDEQALIEALRDGTLGAAGLDVFEREPDVPPALLELENVALAPHVGSATHETRAAMGDLTVDNLLRHFAGQSVLTPVS